MLYILVTCSVCTCVCVCVREREREREREDVKMVLPAVSPWIGNFGYISMECCLNGWPIHINLSVV